MRLLRYVLARCAAKRARTSAGYRHGAARGYSVKRTLRQTKMTTTKKGIAVYCQVCGLRKKPRGRSAGAAMASSLCDDECPGYQKEPLPGDLWPGETDADFGFSCSDNATRPIYDESLAEP